MKKFISVFSLFIRSTVYKITGILCGMIGLELLLLLIFGKIGENSLAYIADSGVFTYVFTISILAAVLLLSLYSCNRSSKLSYTLGRLCIHDKQVFLLQLTVNFLMLWILWMGQLLGALLYSAVYLHRSSPELVNHQTIMIAFYKSSFLQMILPLASVTGWLELGTILIGLSIGCASYSYQQRKGYKDTSVLIFCGVVLFRILLTSDPLYFNLLGNSQDEVIRAATAFILAIGSIVSIVSLIRVGRSEADYA